MNFWDEMPMRPSPVFWEKTRLALASSWKYEIGWDRILFIFMILLAMLLASLK